jgi:peptide chain release factor
MQKLVEHSKQLGLEVELVEHEDGPEDGCMFSATCSVIGSDIVKFRSEWEGSVLWVAQKNSFRKWHRRKNWFVGVAFFKPIQSGKINDRDITFETLRSSGPGGQNVNKVETAVRATHNPSGISVLVTDMRSQVQNKKLALERLIMKLSAVEESKRIQQTHDVWMNHNTLERGNPVKKFKGDL